MLSQMCSLSALHSWGVRFTWSHCTVHIWVTWDPYWPFSCSQTLPTASCPIAPSHLGRDFKCWKGCKGCWVPAASWSAVFTEHGVSLNMDIGSLVLGLHSKIHPCALSCKDSNKNVALKGLIRTENVNISIHEQQWGEKVGAGAGCWNERNRNHLRAGISNWPWECERAVLFPVHIPSTMGLSSSTWGRPGKKPP